MCLKDQMEEQDRSGEGEGVLLKLISCVRQALLPHKTFVMRR